MTMNMPVLPIPMIISLLLFGFLAQRLVRRETHVTLLALIAICAVQAAINALVRYYGFDALRPVQPLMATVIPPVAWFAFSWAAGGVPTGRGIAFHAIGPILALIGLATNPIMLDVLIPLSFAAYGFVMLMQMWVGEDSLPHSRLDNGGMALTAWRIVAVALIASASSDVLISYGLATGYSGFLMWVPSLVSSLSLLSLGALSLTNAIESRREHESESISEEDASRDQAIIAKLDTYLAEHKPYLDPDLTLARLSRKLVVPAKQLSAAINRSKSENVSRFINQHRIEHACGLMSEGRPVTTAMFDSGFNTKSNFNREFLRVKGESPRNWIETKRRRSAQG